MVYAVEEQATLALEVGNVCVVDVLANGALHLEGNVGGD